MVILQSVKAISFWEKANAKLLAKFDKTLSLGQCNEKDFVSESLSSIWSQENVSGGTTIFILTFRISLVAEVIENSSLI